MSIRKLLTVEEICVHAKTDKNMPIEVVQE